MKQITIDQIDYSAQWTGYYWMSDQDRPEVLENVVLEKTLLQQKLPFVVEAQLTCGTCSLSIRNVDGRCRITEYDAADLNDPNNSEEETFISLRMGNRRLCFKRRWQETADVDNLCMGMTTLLPAGLMFTGFKPINEKGD
ncbi:MAG: TIGR04423 family type III CRISPR-associated protein [Muribaculaceae bacterium]|nr:TIGR04423 family type III CRISPR-associated protein [Muribaculaceae bacterium]